MKRLHLIKAAQVIPFVNVLEKTGSPVRKLSERVGMPIDAVYTGKGVIGEYCVWRFIDLAAKHGQLKLLGYEVANQYPINSVEGLGGRRTRTANTLQELLEYFIEDVQAESTGCPYSLKPTTDGIYFVRELMFGEKWKNWQTEQYMIAIIIQITRLCVGSKWLPPEIKISSSKRVLPFPEEWGNINLVWGCNATEIKIPEKILTRPVTRQATQKRSGSDIKHERVPETPLNFTELIRTQILSHSLGIENAAQQTGISTKTLKRKLLQNNTSYSEIVKQLRFELAQSKLKNAATPIQTIARELGYEHHANFTRAFKRMCGITPQEYRKQMDL